MEEIFGPLHQHLLLPKTPRDIARERIAREGMRKDKSLENIIQEMELS